MPEKWMRERVLDEIRNATELGARASRAELQESLGIGAGDLQLVLDELREGGLIREEAVGEYDLNPETAAPPVDPADRLGEGAVAAAARPAPSVLVAPQGTGFVPGEEMCMSRAMIAALDDDALGRLVKAGIEGAGGEFLLRVVA